MLRNVCICTLNHDVIIWLFVYLKQYPKSLTSTITRLVCVCVCVCVCLFANTLTYYIGRDWYSSIISDIMISSYLTSSDLIWLVFKIISCNSDAHFHQSLVIDCLKSQKTYCSIPSQDHGLIKIQFWWSHMPLFLRCCGQAYYCLPTKFKPQVRAKDRCVDDRILTTGTPCLDHE